MKKTQILFILFVLTLLVGVLSFSIASTTMQTYIFSINIMIFFVWILYLFKIESFAKSHPNIYTILYIFFIVVFAVILPKVLIGLLNP